MAKLPRRAVGALAGATLVAGLAACAPQPAESEVTTLKMSMLSYMITGNWNPLTTSYLNTYFASQQAVYETLVRLNGATYEYEPLLAESFEIGDDQRSMSLVLREDVDFTDGTHFDAAAAKEAFADAAEGSVFGGFFDLYGVEVEVVGEYGLEVTSTKPMGSDFMFNFAIIPIVSPTAVETDPTGLETEPVGTGPYLLDEQIPEVSATFVRNPDYRSPEDYPFDALEFIVYDDAIAASNALKSGQINVAQLDVALAPDAESNGFTVHAGGGYVQLLRWTDFDGSVVPALTDRRVRQAIAYAIDREAITESIDLGYGVVTTQSWGEGSPFHLEGEDDRYRYDLERARELMAEAGYEDGFELTIPSIAGLSAPYEPVLAQFLSQIGITLTFVPTADVGEWVEANGSGQYAMALDRNADLFLAGALRPGDEPGTFLPEMVPLFDTLDNGTPEEAAEAEQQIARVVLDEAIWISFSRILETWATIPEITVEVGIIAGWPPLLDSYQLTE